MIIAPRRRPLEKLVEAEERIKRKRAIRAMIDKVKKPGKKKE